MHVAKLLLPAVAALAFSVPAMAQQMPGGTPSVDDQVDQLDEMVDLDEGQKEEMSNLLTQMQDKRKPSSCNSNSASRFSPITMKLPFVRTRSALVT